MTQVGYTILAKEAIQSGVNEFDFMWLRSLVSFFHAFIILKIYGVPLYNGELSENAQMRKMLFLRSCCGLVVVTTMLFAIERIPLGIFNIIASTKVFWSSIVSYFILGEALRGFEIGFMICSFGGILLLAVTEITHCVSSTFLWGLAFVIIYAFVSATNGVLTRMMQKLHHGILLAYY